MQHYIYDGSGERVLKANSDMEAVYENGELVNAPGTVSINGYTSYPSAFIVITADGVYSKHYYAGTQRIVSRLGDNDASIFETGCSACKQQSSTPFEDSKLKQAQIQDLNGYAEKAKKGTVTLKEYKPIAIEEQEKAMATEDNRAYAPPSGAGGLYYYHPDHLGTSTALTDFNGNTYQFFLNLPFGETMAQQLGINYYNSPFKFNGKELDEETGFYYYGARYYDPKISLWLSVDPLAEEFPDWSPYSFCFNNPLSFVDPDGMAPMDIIILGKNNSSVTLKTDLIDIKVNASSLGVDFGGKYTLQGESIVSAGLDIVGILDPTGVADGLNAGLQAKNGDWWGAGISALGVVPYIGDVAKVGKIGKDVKIIENAIDASKTVENTASTSRAARREVMRKEGIPTSQQPKSQSKNSSGREYSYDVPKKGGGTQTKSVQQQTKDRSHPGQPHWEGGKVKTDNGKTRMNNYNRPKLENNKSKVNY